MDLFSDLREANRARARPLAARMRPRTLDEFVGQDHVLGPGKLLRRALLADRLSSVLFYGPPGCGKTALAHVIANHTKSRFVPMNAVSAGTKEVREVLAAARAHLEDAGARTILFLDEIHRFNRTQQDVLLPDVEDGTIILVGATTQNPFFAVNTPLLSRSQVFTLELLTRDHIKTIVRRAVADPERGLGNLAVTVTDDALAFLAETSDGDARRALTALDIGVRSALAPENAASRGRQPPDSPGIVFDLELAKDSIQRKVIDFDPTGDTHYDVASAFIKSLRGSDPDAAVYWLARMLEGGEDPRFVARRLVIFAAEDVGNADPRGVLIANAAWDAVERVGLPECRINLSHAVCYLACAPKSNASYVAVEKALKDVREGRTLPVPAHLRDKNSRSGKEGGRADGYQYPHDFAGGWVGQEYVPTDAVYYEPTDRGFEGQLRAKLDAQRARRKESGGS